MAEEAAAQAAAVAGVGGATRDAKRTRRSRSTSQAQAASVEALACRKPESQAQPLTTTFDVGAASRPSASGWERPEKEAPPWRGPHTGGGGTERTSWSVAMVEGVLHGD